ncbi:MAG TPA: SRPBCC family protein [Xanthomonadaceae bacterium]|jgi:uncharacterized protein YndB with AHSA1/START domain|nr:SRPBCC family protein [Xanthomonadaceae bacterium]
MSANPERIAYHDSFTIERRIDATPAQVFAAWATVEGKSRWFAGTTGEWTLGLREFDFRVGGDERLVGTWRSGTVTDFRAHYHDIVADRRIVYAYAMRLDGKLISVSLATVEIVPDGAGALLRVTEQGAYVDGYDDAGSRERGTRDLIEKLAASVMAAGGSM